MTRIALIRHGVTEWNEQGRIQGHTDTALSDAGRAAVRSWRLPSEIGTCSWAASPLSRARETARILGAPDDLTIEPRLAEMRWGDWEGRTLDALRAELGVAMQENESRGLDFRPPGGESPRDVQARVLTWLRERACTSGTTVAVTHKGVIRAIFALATDWDMTGKPAERLSWSAAHLFSLGSDGLPAVERLNLSLTART